MPLLVQKYGGTSVGTPERIHHVAERIVRTEIETELTGEQRLHDRMRVRATTVANRAHSVVLACSDPNGDKIALTIGSQPKHGRVSGLVKATGSILYTPVAGYTGADSFTYIATDGLDTSAPGTATVSVARPLALPSES